jgi:hypothetical protein
MDEVVNIEKLQRMNVLIRELERHGMARDAAVHEAESILSRESPKENDDYPEPMFPKAAAAKPEPAPEPIQPAGSALLEAKYQYLFEQSFRKFEREVGELKAHLSRVTTELDMLRADLRQLASQHERLKAERAAAPVHAAPAQPAVNHDIESLRQQLVSEPVAAPAPVQAVEAKPEEPKKPQHPRQGNYKPEDVSVEKFFYFGHK